MICSANRKKHQRAINSVVRKFNKSLAQDSLWKGRFYVRQTEAQWVIPYDDKCRELIVTLQCVDKKTGRIWTRTESVNSWIFLNGYKVFDFMNWFIIDYIDYWRKEAKDG